MAHVHAALMRQYADDADEHDEPWRLWEFLWSQNTGWEQCQRSPEWDEIRQYRRKPRTIRIGEFDVPEPMRVAPEKGTRYFLASPIDAKGICWHSNARLVKLAISSGMAHATERAARMHAIALCSLTATPERLAELRKMAAELDDKQ